MEAEEDMGGGDTRRQSMNGNVFLFSICAQEASWKHV